MDRESINRYIHEDHRNAVQKAQAVINNQENQESYVSEALEWVG